MTGNQDAFQKAMNRGHSAAWDQRWELAAGYYRQALEEFPDHAMALTSLGLALYEMEDYDGAMDCYQRAARQNPNDPVSLEKLAHIYERKGKVEMAFQAWVQAAEAYMRARDVDKSIENWVAAIRLQPEHLMARTRLAMIYDRTGRKPEAVAEYLATASIMQRSGDAIKAMQVVEHCLKLQSDSAEARQALGLLKSNQPLPKPARPRGGTGPVRMAEVHKMDAPKSGENEQQLDPVNEARKKALVDLAGLLFDQGEDGQVVQSTRRGLAALARGTGGLSLETAEQTRIQLHIGQAIDSQTRGEDAQAAEELERAMAVGLNRPAVFFDAGLLLQKSDPQKAFRFLQKAVGHPDFALGANLLLGKISLDTGHLNDAATALLHALGMADAETVAEEQREELRQLYEPAVEEASHQTDEAALRNLSTTILNHLLRPDWRDYLARARRQLPAQPAGSPPVALSEMLLGSSNSEVVEVLAEARQLASVGKLYTATEELYYAVQHAPTYLPLHIQMAELLQQQGRQREAVDKFSLVAQLYNLRGESAQAIRLMTRLCDMAPMDVEVRQRLIDMLMAQGRIDDAVAQYTRLAEVYYSLAELDLARQTYLTGLRQAQQSRNTRSLSVQLLNKVADIDMQRLDFRQAIRIYEQLRTLQPDDAPTRQHLIDLNFRMGQDNAALTELDAFLNFLENAGRRSEAIQFLIEMIEERSDRPDLRKRLADVYARAGQVDKAVEILDVLADQLLSAGNKNAALYMIKTIIALNPPNVGDYRNVYQQLTSS